MKYFLLYIFSLAIVLNVFSQNEQIVDSTTVLKDSSLLKLSKRFFKEGHDPAKAALLSAVLPGAGQFYNEKYWKIPVVYAGLGGLGTWLGHNVVQYKRYTEVYKSFFDADTATSLSYNGYTTESQIRFKRKEFKRNLDVSAIALGVWYLLNIVDATVDAHLFDFDVNEDISISFRPDVKLKSVRSLDLDNNIYSGISIQVHFK